MPFDPNNLIDTTPHYWNNKETARFAGQLDTFFVQRSRGQIQPQFREYALPKSQMVELRENRQGGLPLARGLQNSALPSNYATSKITPMTQEARESMQYLNGGTMGMPQNAPYGGTDAVSMNREVDVAQVMQQRMMQQGYSPAQMTQQGFANMPAQGTGPRVVTLIEGHTFYRPLAVSGFPTAMPIVRTGGTIAGIKGPVEMKEVARVYNADGLQRIDASVVIQDTRRHMQLVVVQGTWTNGPVLVAAEAILENGQGRNGTQQLLIDSNQRQQQYQQPQPQQSIEQRMMMHHQQHQMNADQQLLLQQPTRQAPMQQQPQRQISQIDQSSRDLLRKRGLLKG